MTPKAISNGNPRCWHCLNRLVYKKGGGFKFELVVDSLGAEHRVHLDCVDVPSVTASNARQNSKRRNNADTT